MTSLAWRHTSECLRLSLGASCRTRVDTSPGRSWRHRARLRTLATPPPSAPGGRTREPGRRYAWQCRHHAHEPKLTSHDVEAPRRRRPGAERTPVALVDPPPPVLGQVLTREGLRRGVVLVVGRLHPRQARQVPLSTRRSTTSSQRSRRANRGNWETGTSSTGSDTSAVSYARRLSCGCSTSSRWTADATPRRGVVPLKNVQFAVRRRRR